MPRVLRLRKWQVSVPAQAPKPELMVCLRQGVLRWADPKQMGRWHSKKICGQRTGNGDIMFLWGSLLLLLLLKWFIVKDGKGCMGKDAWERMHGKGCMCVVPHKEQCWDTGWAHSDFGPCCRGAAGVEARGCWETAHTHLWCSKLPPCKQTKPHCTLWIFSLTICFSCLHITAVTWVSCV